jgi:hypothetical protein
MFISDMNIGHAAKDILPLPVIDGRKPILQSMGGRSFAESI